VSRPGSLWTLRIARTVHAGEAATENFGPLYNDGGADRRNHLAMRQRPRQIVDRGRRVTGVTGR
jgi:hypothetical protein